MGLLGEAVDWQTRAAVCERCHLRHVKCGISYCGRPLVNLPFRDEAVDGCGCPCREKAKRPGEHCPIDAHALAAHRDQSGCSCKWCESPS